LGWLYVVLAGGQVALATAVGEPLAKALIDFVLVDGPGIILLYVEHRLPKNELHPEAYHGRRLAPPAERRLNEPTCGRGFRLGFARTAAFNRFPCDYRRHVLSNPHPDGRHA
jgi:hypothetical protein